MKKLNRKGFTLIELLAVIVILAIILVVTVPNIINSITDARLSSIHNLAVSAANTYNTAYAQDLLETTPEDRILGDLVDEVDETWNCIGNITTSDRKLADVLGLSENDLVLNATGDNPKIATDENRANIDNIALPCRDHILQNIDNTYCSSIRQKGNGNIEIILVASSTGKFNVSGKNVYAYSEDSKAIGHE